MSRVSNRGMKNKNTVVLVVLACLLVLAGLGAFLLLDDSRAAAAQRPDIPRVQR